MRLVRHLTNDQRHAFRKVCSPISSCIRYNSIELRSGRRCGFSVEASTATSTTLLIPPDDELRNIKITKTSTKQSRKPSSFKQESVDATGLVDYLLQYTRSLMDSSEADDDSSEKGGRHSALTVERRHIVAFSGGIDSSVVAALVYQSADHNSGTESVKAVLGLSPAVPADQIHLAEQVASQIGIDLEKIPTTEGQDETYIANDGQACLACKTHLYTCLTSIANHYSPPASPEVRSSSMSQEYGHRRQPQHQLIMYNGTNADDLKDPTRLGLIAADRFRVRSPLRYTSKDLVRLAGRHLGLSNWQYAASPCLRSRLALGVPALPEHLLQIERAEAFVRGRLQLSTTRNMRVRLLSKNCAMIEVEEDVLEQARECLMTTMPTGGGNEAD